MRDEAYLIDLVENLRKFPKETDWLEFKCNYYEPHLIGEYISALSNAATLNNVPYGYLIYGIDDDSHEIVGTNIALKDKKKCNEDLESWITRLLNPKINFNFYDIEINNKKVAIIEIKRAEHTITKFESTAYIRIGTTKKPLINFVGKEKELWRVLNSMPFETCISIDNLTSTEVLQKLEYSSYFDLLNIPLPDNSNGILEYLVAEDFIVKNQNGKLGITNLGAILFAKNINDFKNIKRKNIRVIQYDGKNKLNTIREDTGDKGYAVIFESIIKYINTIIPKNEIIEEALRKEVSMYPEIAIREAVANSLVHQDFNITGAGPMVEIYSDRIEVTNPGNPLVKTDRFIDNPPKSRNEQLASFLRRIGVCEERGSGFDKIVYSTEFYQLPAPKIEVYDESTKVTLFAHKPYEDMSKEDKIRACYMHACLKYVSNEHLTNASLRQRFGIEQNSAVSKLIKKALDDRKIKPYDKETAPRYMEYIPYWA